jgi:hypothetical protein
VLSESRGGEFAFLIDEIALGDQHQPIAVGKARDGFLDARQRFDRMAQHLAPGGKDVADHGTDLGRASHIHGGLDQGQGETLHAVTVEPQIASLDLGQPRFQVSRPAERRKKLGEPGEVKAEDAFVVPERVVGIEADGRQAQAAWALVTRRTEAGYLARLAAGRIGRRTSSPPQLGQTPAKRASAQ